MNNSFSLGDFPPEIKIHIARHFSMKGLARYGQINREFHVIANEDGLYKKFLRVDKLNFAQLLDFKNLSGKMLFFHLINNERTNEIKKLFVEIKIFFQNLGTGFVGHMTILFPHQPKFFINIKFAKTQINNYDEIYGETKKGQSCKEMIARNKIDHKKFFKVNSISKIYLFSQKLKRSKGKRIRYCSFIKFPSLKSIRLIYIAGKIPEEFEEKHQIFKEIMNHLC